MKHLFGSLVVALMSFNSSATDSCPVNFAQVENHKSCDVNCVYDLFPGFSPEGSLQLIANYRQSLLKELTNFSVGSECRRELERTLVVLRDYSDLIGAQITPQVDISNFDFKKMPAPLLNSKDYPPYFLTYHQDRNSFAHGDIMITKGVSLVSSSITQLTQDSSPFSHIVFVNEENHQLFTIESYIGQGVSLFNLKEALQNENARILVLRAKDQALAEEASTLMGNKVRELESRGEKIPYDYELDFNDEDSLSCEEIPYYAFKTVSKNKLILPERSSYLSLTNPDLLRRFNLKTGPLMMPGDMEFDSRFEVVVDWTNFSLIRDSWRKDAMMNVILSAINNGNYQLPETFSSRLVRLIWKTRRIKWLWPVISKITGIPRETQADVPAINLATMASFKNIEGYFLPRLKDFDTKKFQENGVWPTRYALEEEMKKLLGLNSAILESKLAKDISIISSDI